MTVVYRPPRCAIFSLLELANLVSDVRLGSLKPLVLGDISLHTKARDDRPDQDFNLGPLSQRVSEPMYQVVGAQGVDLDRIFCSREGHRSVEDIVITLLSWTGRCQVSFRLTGAPSLCSLQRGPIVNALLGSGHLPAL